MHSEDKKVYNNTLSDFKKNTQEMMSKKQIEVENLVDHPFYSYLIQLPGDVGYVHAPRKTLHTFETTLQTDLKVLGSISRFG